MSGQEAAKKLRPKSRSDWKGIEVICGCVVLAFAVVVAISFFKHRQQEDIERTWQSAPATIDDARPVIASRVESVRGGAMLYQLEVLASYNAEGAARRRWIRVGRQPELLADAQLQAFRWKGRHCLVRWKPSHPEQVIVEAN
jgi:hypothetical protein